jgi:hypothetical protein
MMLSMEARRDFDGWDAGLTPKFGTLGGKSLGASGMML